MRNGFTRVGASTVLIVAASAFGSLSVNAIDGEHPSTGAWQLVNGVESYVLFQDSTISIWDDGALAIGRIIALSKNRLVAILNGGELEFTLHVEDDLMTFRAHLPGERPAQYRRMKDIPHQLLPMVFGDAVELDMSTLDEVKGELGKRFLEDQAVRTVRSRAKDAHDVDSDNTMYIRDLVLRLGWIDAKRFGVEATTIAFLLVQHSGDIRLMMAALPFIEHDVREGRLGAEAFALLFDRVQIMTGKKQRYGSQVIVKNGKAVALPLADPANVDVYRMEIGLPPLADYLLLNEELEKRRKSSQ